jgi:hypothetical protein
MPGVEFESMITVFELRKTFNGLESVAAVIGGSVIELCLNIRHLEILQQSLE